MPQYVTIPMPLQFVRQFNKAPYLDMTFDTTADRVAYLSSPRRYGGMQVVDKELEQCFYLNTAEDTWLSLVPPGGLGKGLGSIETTITFDGSAGKGGVGGGMNFDIEVDIPIGSFIALAYINVITPLVSEDDTSYITLGIQTDDETAVLQSTDSNALVTQLNTNIVTGIITPALSKATDNRILVGEIGGSNITAGSIELIIVISDILTDGGVGGSGVSLRTNSTPNDVQNILDLVDSDTVTWEYTGFGQVIAHSVGGGGGGDAVTASNGLQRIVDDISWGGVLSTGVAITGGVNSISFTSSSVNQTLGIISTGSGFALQLQSTGNAAAEFIASDTNTSDRRVVMSINRASTTVGANGVGGQIDFYNANSVGGSSYAGSFANILTDVTDGVEDSQFEWYLQKTGGTHRRMALTKDGQLILDAYVSTDMTGGTATYALATDVDGKVMKIALGGGGGSNTIYTANDNITGDRTIGLASHNIVFVDSITSVGVLIDPDTVVLGDLTRTNTYLLTDVLNKTISASAADGTAVAAITLVGDSGGGVVFGLNANSATSGCGITGDGNSGNISYNVGTGSKHEFGGILQFDDVAGAASHANNAAAITAGLTAGQLYYTNVAGDGLLKIVI